MAYLCPVCEDPQVDATHLANHLAFTAIIRGGDHEAWLDRTVPDWSDHEESWLAERVRETLEAVDHPVDDVDAGGRGGARDAPAVDPAVATDGLEEGALDDDARSVVEEARELTRRMADDTGATGGEADDTGATDRDGSAEGETD